MEVIFPRDGAHVYIPTELDGSRGKVVVEAAHREKETQIYWHMDSLYVGTTRHIHQMAFSPPKGRHRITLVDESGNTCGISFTVADEPTIN
jgi:penicillin-binding protein 1C